MQFLRYQVLVVFDDGLNWQAIQVEAAMFRGSRRLMMGEDGEGSGIQS